MAEASLLKRLTQSSSAITTLLVAAVALFTLSPFLTTLRPPMQDLPQHLAAGRVLLDGDPSLSFDDYFTSEWARSQYLGIYVLLGLFFYPLEWLALSTHPLLLANRCAIIVLLATWAGGAEWLGRRAVGRVGFGVFALALFFNVHLILGFLNFLLGVAFALLGLALFAELRARSARPQLRDWRLWALGLVALSCFYFHVVPFGILLGVTVASGCFDWALAAWQRRRRAETSLARAHWSTYAALGPALLALLFWLTTPAGLSTREAASGGGSRGKAQYLSFEANHQALPAWTLDSFRSEWDIQWLLVALAIFALYGAVEVVLVAVERRSKSAAGPLDAGDQEPAVPKDPVLVWLLRLTAPACFVAYYVLPASYDWIWPINARFPVLALLFLPYWLPTSIATPTGPHSSLARVRTWASAAFITVVASAAVGQAVVARAAFAGYDDEISGLDAVLEEIPLGKRVVTLVFDRGSRHIGYSPFLHVGAYYQAERGGVSFFSFNDFPQSPVRFLDANRPPKVEPRWEWKPEKVRPDRDLTWFDYLIVRGGPATLKGADGFAQLSSHGRFRLYQRKN